MPGKLSLKSFYLVGVVLTRFFYELKMLDGKNRNNISIGLEVEIVQKQDQRSGELTEGTVSRILTNSNYHPHGIKVQLETGEVGRVKYILS